MHIFSIDCHRNRFRGFWDNCRCPDNINDCLLRIGRKQLHTAVLFTLITLVIVVNKFKKFCRMVFDRVGARTLVDLSIFRRPSLNVLKYHVKLFANG